MIQDVAINIQCLPVPLIWANGKPLIPILTDDQGEVLTDETNIPINEG